MNSAQDILKDIDGIDDIETLKYLLNVIQNKLVSKGTERK